MNRKMIWVAAALTIFASPAALAQDTIIEHLVTACESDIENYCSQVTPGNGRMLHCMAAHEDKISGQCEYAFYQAASLLEQLAVAINYLAQECGTEIQTLCSDIEPGEGRLLTCLEQNEEEVGVACKKAVADTVVSE